MHELELTREQAAFVAHPAKYLLFAGGVGSGKTTAGAVRTMARLLPGEVGAIIAPTFPMLEQSTLRTLTGLLEKAGVPYIHLKSESTLSVNGATVYLRTTDDEQRLRGVSLSFAWLDESSLMSEESWNITLGRLRLGDHPQAWCTSTPRGLGSWMHKRFVLAQDPSHAMIVATTASNPYTPKEYREDLYRQFAGAYAEEQLGGLFTQAQGLVYSAFNVAMHVVPASSIPRGRRKGCGIDFGFVNDFAAVFGLLDEDERLYLYSEHVRARELLYMHAAEIVSRGAVDFYVSDHDAQDRKELALYGIRTRPARKDVRTGIMAVTRRLVVQGDGRPRLLVSEECVNTIRELQSYVWEEDTPGKAGKEAPQKVSDHCMDALRYLTMELDRPVQKITSLYEEVGMSGYGRGRDTR